MKSRVVMPELLDELPSGDARAVRSRADLARLNFIMGHAGVLARQWAEASLAIGPVGHLVEFGAGDGTLPLRWIARLPATLRPGKATFVDRQSLISARTQSLIEGLGVQVNVVESDLFEWLERGDEFDVGVANLFLHHFESAALRRMFDRVAGCCRGIMAVEPRRAFLGGVASRLVGLVGCNAVTRHDAVVSVRAGFVGNELSTLWPDPVGWDLVECPAGLFSHAFLATRRR